MTAVVMFLVGGAMVSAWLITVADLPGQLVGMLGGLLESPKLFMLAVVPDYAGDRNVDGHDTEHPDPGAGADAGGQTGGNRSGAYFGVVFVMANAIGLITPPVGTSLTAVCGVSLALPVGRVVAGMWPFLLAEVGVLVALVAFSQLVTVTVDFPVPLRNGWGVMSTSDLEASFLATTYCVDVCGGAF